ncbi:MAG: hypothetical protein MUE51_15890 [Thermoleophilia bacterium]|nr:hypothetical protein [Thermoleophilia bacterium]
MATSGAGPPPPAPSGWRAAATSIEFAAVAGLVCAIAWSLGILGLLDRPGLDATREEWTRYLADPGAGGPVAVYLALMVLGTVAFLWFVGVVRARLGERESRLVGSVFLGGSVLLTGLILAGVSALAAPSILVDAGGAADPGAAGTARSLAAIMLSVFSARVATLVMFALATLARQTRALPTWAIVVTYVVGVVEFVNVTLSEPALFLFPAWIAFVSVLLLARRPGPAPALAGAG